MSFLTQFSIDLGTQRFLDYQQTSNLTAEVSAEDFGSNIMKRLTWIAVVMFVIIAVTGSSWILRGFYDRIFMYEGHFHITSTASEDYDIELSFPSGQSYSFGLPSLGSHTFVMTETGEGGIQVMIDGKVREKVGYVTSMKEICVLSIGDRAVVFSQLFPRSDAR